jgi:F-type H+-transporting ATPase subunit alpha
MEDQVIIIFAGINNLLEDIEVAQVGAFEKGLLKYAAEKHPDIRKEIAEKKALSDDLKKKIEGVIKEYKAIFKK